MNTEDVKAMTLKLLTEWFNGKPGLLIRYLAGDVLWIGRDDEKIINGRDSVQAILSEQDDMVCKIRDTLVAMLDDNSCVVFCTVTEAVLTGNVCRNQSLRYTFVWKKLQTAPQIAHVHESVLEKDTSNEGILRITLRDVSGNILLLKEQDILVVEAQKNHAIIHCKQQDMEVSASLTEVENMLSDRFCRCHRSYIVNIWYVERIQRYRIWMNNGLVVPIPEKKYLEVKKRIIEHQRM